MNQVGWDVWAGSEQFESLTGMKAWAEDKLEEWEGEGSGSDGLVVMIGYNLVEGGYALKHISLWEPSIVDQVKYDTHHFEPLFDGDE